MFLDNEPKGDDADVLAVTSEPRKRRRSSHRREKLTNNWQTPTKRRRPDTP